MKRSDGFTYLGLLILVAVIAFAASTSLHISSILQRRAAEAELFAIGVEFRNALASYANATPPGQRRYPRTIDDLLGDNRSPMPARHLRRIYPDPLTGRSEWGIVEALDGSGIVGFYSLAETAPFKIGNFDALFSEFSGKTSYRDWVFMFERQPVHMPIPEKR